MTTFNALAKEAYLESIDAPGPFRKRGGRRGQYIAPEDRKFIAWDGEGQDLRGKNKPQSYVLYGASTGDKLVNVKPEGLDVYELCEFMIRVAEANPGAWHIGFAFDYDFNMIVQHLTDRQKRRLWENQFVNLRTSTGVKYCIRVCRGKWLSISRHEWGWNRKTRSHRKNTIRIFDIFSFFGTSFIRACIEMGLDNTEEFQKVVEGKKHRGGTGHCPECGDAKCPFDDIDYVEAYWLAEIKLLAQCANELRSTLYSADMKITTWYGPGALASYLMKRNKVKEHMKEPINAVLDASQYAYAGGRFEAFKVGRITGPVYGYDLNSAYPNALRRMPSLSNGEWVHVRHPKELVEFGVYQVNMEGRANSIYARKPGPMFHRDQKANISFPWHLSGWYWSPEVWHSRKRSNIEITEGWEFHPSTDEKPFAFIEDMYNQRRIWKTEGNVSQWALKIGMNSIYGKLAQRIGWTEANQRIPPWHRLEWAGWTTSYARGQLWYMMNKVPFEKLIAVETDGFYTTMAPEELGITGNKELGGWEVTKYDEVIYIQSGLAWLKGEPSEQYPDGWIPKRRGLDPDTFKLHHAIEYVKSLGPIFPGRMTKWEPFVGLQTRFYGLGAALASSEPLSDIHCSWRTTPKEIHAGQSGKRIHVPPMCHACRLGADAHDMPHDLVINDPQSRDSHMHHVPWRAIDTGNTVPDWMLQAEIEAEMHRG